LHGGDAASSSAAIATFTPVAAIRALGPGDWIAITGGRSSGTSLALPTSARCTVSHPTTVASVSTTATSALPASQATRSLNPSRARIVSLPAEADSVSFPAPPSI